VFDELSRDQVDALDRISRTVADLIDAACVGREDSCVDACDD
jgi:hypothetical protein